MTARLVLTKWDERIAFEAEARGYYAGALVELDDGRRVRVSFWDLTRLGQDLADEARAGRPFVGDPGMIVLTLVTQANMEAAVLRLERERFFDAFVGIAEGTP